MRKNQYFKSVVTPGNFFQIGWPQYSMILAQVFRGPIEVFLRRDWGVRHFSFWLNLLLLLALAAYPIRMSGLGTAYSMDSLLTFDWRHFFLLYASWYAFLILSFEYWLKRKREVSREASSVDFSHYSMSTGRLLPFFYSTKIRGRYVSVRQIETWVEPAFFIAIGVLLACLYQPVGLLIGLLSLFYSYSYFAQYSLGDTFILNQIDEAICNAELAQTMIEGRDENTDSGFRFYGRKPVDIETRRKLADWLDGPSSHTDNEREAE